VDIEVVSEEVVDEWERTGRRGEHDDGGSVR
jgi:hypothetical protein